jgi:hypothetical protein
MTLKPGPTERARTVGHVSHARQVRVDRRAHDILARRAALDRARRAAQRINSARARSMNILAVAGSGRALLQASRAGRVDLARVFPDVLMGGRLFPTGSERDLGAATDDRSSRPTSMSLALGSQTSSWQDLLGPTDRALKIRGAANSGRTSRK